MNKKEKKDLANKVHYNEIDFNVKWKLSKEEIENLKKKHLENLDKIDELKVAKKRISDVYKMNIKELEIDNYKLRETIKKETETRTVICKVMYDYENGTRIVYHPQTNEVVNERPLTDEEKQMTFLE